MKQQSLKTIRTILCTLTLAVLLAGAIDTLHAQSDNEPTTTPRAGQGGILNVIEQMRQAQAQQLEGSWTVTVTPAVPSGVQQPPSFIGHATIARGGAFFGSDRTRPLSKQHGVWAHLGGPEFAWTFTEDLFDIMGGLAGKLTVRVKLNVTGKDTFVGVSNGEQRDAADNLIFNRCSTIRGERIKLEPLSAQCQNITPPQ